MARASVRKLEGESVGKVKLWDQHRVRIGAQKLLDELVIFHQVRVLLQGSAALIYTL